MSILLFVCLFLISLVVEEFKSFYKDAKFNTGVSFTPKTILNFPLDRKVLPWKLLQFGENFRPAYYGIDDL
jgi:hypothetical protein